MCPHPLAPPSALPDFSLTFPPDPVWVRTCREAVRASARAGKRLGGELAELAELVELAVLLTSEAASNAVTASVAARCRTPITLTGEWLAGGPLRVHVRDAAPGVPYVNEAGEDAEGGRGMYLIAALASRYGVCLDGPGPGKSFWFQVGRGAAA